MPAARTIDLTDPLAPADAWPGLTDHVETLWKKVVTIITTAGTASAYLGTTTPAVIAPATSGQPFILVPHVSCLADATLNIDGSGTASLADEDGENVADGDLVNGRAYLIISYSGKYRVVGSLTIARQLTDISFDLAGRVYGYSANVGGWLYAFGVEQSDGSYEVLGGGLNDVYRWDIEAENDHPIQRAYSTEVAQGLVGDDDATVIDAIPTPEVGPLWFVEYRTGSPGQELWLWRDGIDAFRVFGDTDSVVSASVQGDWVHAQIEDLTTSPIPDQPFSRRSLQISWDTEFDDGVEIVYWVPSLGQSLATGHGSVSSVVDGSVRDAGRVQMFPQGIRTFAEQNSAWQTFPISKWALRRTIDAYEKSDGLARTTGLGKLANLMLPGLPSGISGIVIHTAGVGATTFDQHAGAAAQPYLNLLTATERAYVMAKAAGRDFVAPFLYFPSGSANASTAQATYVSNLQSLQDRYQTFIQELTDDPSLTVPLLMIQPANGASAFTLAGSALAMLQLALSDPTLFWLVGPGYPYPTQDTIHPTGVGYELMAADAARLYADAISGSPSGVGPTPLHCIDAEITGSTIVTQWDVHGGGTLEEEASPAWVDDPGDLGVIYRDTGGNAPVIDSYAFTGALEITFELDIVPTGTAPELHIGAIGDFANSGPITGLRSSIYQQSTDTVDIDGNGPESGGFYNQRRYACQQVVSVHT